MTDLSTKLSNEKYNQAAYPFLSVVLFELIFFSMKLKEFGRVLHLNARKSPISSVLCWE